MILITDIIVKLVLFFSHRDNPTNGGGSLGTNCTSKTENASNKMEMEDLPAESYEEVEAPDPLPMSLKLQPKNKPRNATHKVDSDRYAQGAKASPKPAGAHTQVHLQGHSHNCPPQQQQQQPVYSNSTVATYEWMD